MFEESSVSNQVLFYVCERLRVMKITSEDTDAKKERERKVI